MKKMMFKKILCIINYTHHDVSSDNLIAYIQHQLHEDHMEVPVDDVKRALVYITEKGILYHDQTGYDLIPCACVFAKADEQSITEALAFLECFLKDAQVLDNVYMICKDKKSFFKIFDSFTWDILLQTILLDIKSNHFFINPALVSDVMAIIQEYKNKTIVISSTLSAIYANGLIHHEDHSIKYRNESKEMVPYDNVESILRIIPRMGIPENRDITKPVQTFYKDTLMYDFHHACPLCGIDIPQLLVASHIKPFRDCAHIYEALDYHNGILLCKNHDFLFDQGYISFDNSGNILICEELQNRKELYLALQIDDNKTIIDNMNENRALFLQYHQRVIFKDHS